MPTINIIFLLLFLLLQHVTYNGDNKCKTYSRCGVPQGSMLSPLLFLIHINCLSNVCNNMMSLLFEDDANLFHSGSDAYGIQQEINADLMQISQWLKIFKSSLNVKKIHFMVFMNKNPSKPNNDLQTECIRCIHSRAFQYQIDLHMLHNFVVALPAH